MQTTLDPDPLRLAGPTWQASSARRHFSDVVNAAVAGHPQFIRRRDGREVVLVSREYFEQTRPNLKSYLLTAGFAEGPQDAFDSLLAETRGEVGASVTPRSPGT